MIDRLMKHVYKNKSGCWLWRGTIDSKGYGQMRLIGRRHYRCHRISYQFFVGAIPPGKMILHSCDIKNCVNPEHLRPGTAKDNMQDALKRNRLKPARGERSGRAILTEDLVIWIRENSKPYDKHLSRAALARKFGVSASTIRELILKNNWKHL